MRVQLILLIGLLLNSTVWANNEKEMQTLFEKYDAIVKYHEVEFVEEVFSQKFLKENGGKEEFVTKVLDSPKEKKPKKLKRILQSWKKGKVGKIIFAKVKDDEKSDPSQFVIVEENGKLKIDGTISDGH